MTRSIQKREESEILRALLSATGIRPDSDPVEGEKPDFMIELSSRAVGVEVVMYQSGGTVVRAGRCPIERRAVESEWERLEAYSREFLKKHPGLNGIYTLLRFNGTVPSQEEQNSFLEEIVEFAKSRQEEAREGYVEFGMADYASPLMKTYLKPIGGITLRRSEHGELDSNITAGFVDSCPAATISKIVAKKTKLAEAYRTTEELWLVIGQSGRLSEMVLPITGASDFNADPDLQVSLLSSPFSRVFVFAAIGLLQWDKRACNWTECR